MRLVAVTVLSTAPALKLMPPAVVTVPPVCGVPTVKGNRVGKFSVAKNVGPVCCAVPIGCCQSNSLVSLAKNYKKNFKEIFNVSSIKNLGIIDIQKKIFNLSKNNEI